MAAPISDSGDAIRVYKLGSATYRDVTSADVGGYSRLEVTEVRNEPGSLRFSLEATTIAMLAEWLDEASTVELWIGGHCRGIYQVDDYTPRWSALTCDVNCVGLLVATKGTPFSGSFTGQSGMKILDALIAAVPELTWDPEQVLGADAIVEVMEYSDKDVFAAITELGQLLGFDFWVDPRGAFVTEPWPTEVDRVFTLNVDAHEFDTSYSAKGITNRLTLASDAGTWTFDELTSQALYGVRSQKVSATGIVSQPVAAAWATSVFASLAWPIQLIALEVDHSNLNATGIMASVSGVADGRVYRDIISQVTWTVGDLTDELQIGHQPPALTPPESIAGKGGKDGVDAQSRAATSINAFVAGSYIVATMDASDADWTKHFNTNLILQKLVAGEWKEKSVDVSKTGLEFSFPIILPPVGKTDFYRILYKGNTYLSPCFSSTIDATTEGLTWGTGGGASLRQATVSAVNVNSVDLTFADATTASGVPWLGDIVLSVGDTVVFGEVAQ